MRTAIALLVAAAVIFPLSAYATEVSWDLWDPYVLPDSHTVSGAVWGTWTAPDTYYVIGQVRVPPGSTLLIEPGVTVLFSSYCRFIVDSTATLLAIGTETDSILFSTPFPQNGWHGIRFFHADSSSQLSYCRIEYGKALGSGDNGNGGAIFCSYSDIVISNNGITDNLASGDGGGIYCYYSNPQVSNNIIHGNTANGGGGGVYCGNSNPSISGNTIRNNMGADGSGIYCDRCSPTIDDNIMTHNSGGGIYCSNSSPTISNNTITSGGIKCYSNSSPTISSNTITDNGDGIYCSHSSPTIISNTISGNARGIRCDNNSSPTISDNIITDNMLRSREGSAIYCSDYSSPTISDNNISGNSGGVVIYCDRSSPTISGNDMTRNSGGAIRCDRSTLTITDNIITDNTGRAIYCYNSTLTVRNNIISDNSATGSGGAIFSSGGSLQISNNSIRCNSATGSGGGIWCTNHSAVSMSDNVISRNSASLDGGGIDANDSQLEMSKNTIGENSASNKGGGISCSSSILVIVNTTLSKNSAGQGGGLHCYSSSPTLTNTILWADSSEGGEVYLEQGSSPRITYCDIQGGWIGQGNIDADPLFVGPYNEDFYLRWHSPCIDAGLPDSLDPDGTISDIGAFYFNQDVNGIVEVYPHDEPIVIAPEGGELIYDGGVINFTQTNLVVDIWACAFVPGFSRPQRIWRYNNITIPAEDSIIKPNLTETVPDFAPSGDYAFVTYIGDYPSSIIDSSLFYFSKEESGYASSGIDDWQTLKGWFEEGFLSLEAALPTHYTLSQNYPNPFNAVTTIHYQLPAAGQVNLEVYNALGQKVATLVDSKQQAGYRSVIWDASKVSSGLYFYKLTAGDFTETRRMILVK